MREVSFSLLGKLRLNLAPNNKLADTCIFASLLWYIAQQIRASRLESFRNEKLFDILFEVPPVSDSSVEFCHLRREGLFVPLKKRFCSSYISWNHDSAVHLESCLTRLSLAQQGLFRGWLWLECYRERTRRPKNMQVKKPKISIPGIRRRQYLPSACKGCLRTCQVSCPRYHKA